MSTLGHRAISNKIIEIAVELVNKGEHELGCTLILLVVSIVEMEDIIDKMIRNLEAEGRRTEDMS